ncbi:MAG: hypothetical protein OXR62_02260 [Ahrensia sp.]|nr:hypothetical protein [Ahrensia sp.]
MDIRSVSLASDTMPAKGDARIEKGDPQKPFARFLKDDGNGKALTAREDGPLADPMRDAGDLRAKLKANDVLLDRASVLAAMKSDQKMPKGENNVLGLAKPIENLLTSARSGEKQGDPVNLEGLIDALQTPDAQPKEESLTAAFDETIDIDSIGDAVDEIVNADAMVDLEPVIDAETDAFDVPLDDEVPVGDFIEEPIAAEPAPLRVETIPAGAVPPVNAASNRVDTKPLTAEASVAPPIVEAVAAERPGGERISLTPETPRADMMRAASFAVVGNNQNAVSAALPLAGAMLDDIDAAGAILPPNSAAPEMSSLAPLREIAAPRAAGPAQMIATLLPQMRVPDTIRVSLNPVELGSIQIVIQRAEEGVRVHLMAETDAGYTALMAERERVEDVIKDLRNALQNQDGDERSFLGSERQMDDSRSDATFWSDETFAGETEDAQDGTELASPAGQTGLRNTV